MSLVSMPVPVDENSELDAMYGSVGGPVAWEQLQAEAVKKQRKKGVIEAIAQALQASTSPAEAGRVQAGGGMGSGQAQAQAQQDQQLGVNIGSLARSIGTRIFDTSGYAIWGDEDNDENDDDVIARLAALNRDLPETEHLEMNNVQELKEGEAALVGGRGPEIMRREGNAVQITPVARPHADALMEAIRRQAAFKEKKPGVKSRIAAALLGGAQGLLASSPTHAVQRSAAMMAPSVHGAISRLGDGGNSAARRRIAEEIQARTRAAQIEEGQMEYEARRQHEARMGQRAGESAAAAQARWELSERNKQRQHDEIVRRLEARARQPQDKVIGDTWVQRDPATGEVKKLFEKPEKPAAPRYSQYVNEQGVYTTDLNNPGAPAVPRVGPDGKPLPGRVPRPTSANPFSAPNSQAMLVDRQLDAQASELAGSVRIAVGLSGQSHGQDTYTRELLKQAGTQKLPPAVVDKAADKLGLTTQKADPTIERLKAFGLVGGSGQTAAPPAPQLNVNPNTIQRR